MGEFKKAGMIGAGSMGGGMALLFTENGLDVSILDPSTATVDKILSEAQELGRKDKLTKHEDYESLCKSLPSPRVIFFSLPHGQVGDDVLTGLKPYLDKGDIVVDCSNENWESTERRQGSLVSRGVFYVGCGVSGGYQAARRSPSMCPGGQDEGLDFIMPFLQKVAAKDKNGNSCVAKVGQGGSGHYVKMVHNGIEHGMMSAVSEAWQIMTKQLGMQYDEVGKVFESWCTSGELENTFLIKIAADICQKKNDKGDYVLADVQDKVVQDVDGTEGTGIWSNMQAVELHVAAPTLNVAHNLRIASADRAQRSRTHSVFKTSFDQSKINLDHQRADFLENLRVAVYTACLTSYVQGINIICVADRKNKWHISYPSIPQIWRAGCIIQADRITDLLEEIFSKPVENNDYNLLYQPKIASELKQGFDALKKVVLKGTECDAVIPSLSASLEYLKYVGNLDLPTQFYEAELDYFGKHMYDSKSKDPDPGEPVSGQRHFEWKKA